jgi:hypothetical protein
VKGMKHARSLRGELQACPAKTLRTHATDELAQTLSPVPSSSTRPRAKETRLDCASDSHPREDRRQPPTARAAMSPAGKL